MEKQIRVLLAEDDEANAKAARMMLEQLGCTVDIAKDGAKAVDHFRTRDYDLILMDAQMPRVTGIEATVQIRSMPGGQTIPIVGTTSGESHLECLQSGMNEIVPKPFVLEKMRYVLSRWTNWTAGPKRNCAQS